MSKLLYKLLYLQLNNNFQEAGRGEGWRETENIDGEKWVLLKGGITVL